MTPESTLRVETPEGVVFAFGLASPLTRALAYAIDLAAIVALTTALTNSVQIFAIVGTDWTGALSVVFAFLISIAYGILLEWRWRGQTLGKRVMRLRVIDAGGLRLEFTQVVVRNLLRAVDMLPGLISGRRKRGAGIRKVSAVGRSWRWNHRHPRADDPGGRSGTDRAR